MCIRAVRAEGKGDGGIEDAKLPHHLLHASDGALFVCVGELDHQAGGSALRVRQKQEKIMVCSVKHRGAHVTRDPLHL